jgi:hypothetical protein
MCPQCEALAERREIPTPGQYFKILAQVKGFLRDHVLELVSGPPLDAIREDRTWPSDTLAHVLRCADCGQEFALTADTYHGNARWQPRAAGD